MVPFAMSARAPRHNPSGCHHWTLYLLSLLRGRWPHPSWACWRVTILGNLKLLSFAREHYWCSWRLPVAGIWSRLLELPLLCEKWAVHAVIAALPLLETVLIIAYHTARILSVIRACCLTVERLKRCYCFILAIALWVEAAFLSYQGIP